MARRMQHLSTRVLFILTVTLVRTNPMEHPYMHGFLAVRGRSRAASEENDVQDEEK